MTDARIPPHHDPACSGAAKPGRARGCRCRPRRAPRVRGVPPFDERHQGGPGIVHGGLVAAALDEAGGCSRPGTASRPSRRGSSCATGGRSRSTRELMVSRPRRVGTRPADPRRGGARATATRCLRRRGPRSSTSRSSTSSRRRGTCGRPPLARAPRLALPVRCRDGGRKPEADEDPAGDPALERQVLAQPPGARARDQRPDAVADEREGDEQAARRSRAAPSRGRRRRRRTAGGRRRRRAPSSGSAR